MLLLTPHSPPLPCRCAASRVSPRISPRPPSPPSSAKARPSPPLPLPRPLLLRGGDPKTVPLAFPRRWRAVAAAAGGDLRARWRRWLPTTLGGVRGGGARTSHSLALHHRLHLESRPPSAVLPPPPSLPPLQLLLLLLLQGPQRQGRARGRQWRVPRGRDTASFRPPTLRPAGTCTISRRLEGVRGGEGAWGRGGEGGGGEGGGQG